ncbi:ZIP family metal transporter [uncultured Holdemanella sp.]|jgi:ZIP family zinc transporter|uniref:ZIP family metal transporter n=1 Tax=uncultured Holdemanella sp. TaxID=1763549 RepID=UPI0025F8B432|nr:ZIP family metal transporter [uncultured Holdemanella sp.]
MIMWLGLLIPFFGTTLGSACVYFLKNKNNELLSRCFSGIASGVMVAASIWSLLMPAMEQEKNILIIVLGIFLGALLLLFLDCIIPHIHPGTNDEEGKNSHLNKTTKLVFAVTLHNIPEGMAVGVVLAQAIQTGNYFSALALSIGIAIQNFPEGAILSLPLKSNGFSKNKAFLIGALSGIVEPIFGYITILFSNWILQGLPLCLSFAAGAMLFVVIEELVPEMAQGKHSNLPTLFFLLGFCIMMMLDVLLG